MKLALFGATGSVGRHVLRLAIAGGHQVNAFVRLARCAQHVQIGGDGLCVPTVIEDRQRRR